jgi:hypothetical protein
MAPHSKIVGSAFQSAPCFALGQGGAPPPKMARRFPEAGHLKVVQRRFTSFGFTHGP